MSTTETRLAFSDVKWPGACGGDSATRTEVLWIPVGGRVSGLRRNAHRIVEHGNSAIRTYRIAIRR